MNENILTFWRDGALTNFNVLFDDAPIKMHAIDKNGILLNVSRFWAKSLGYDRSEMIGRRSSDFLTEDSRTYATETALPIFFRDGQIEDVEYDFVRKDGSIMTVLMSAVAQTEPSGAFAHSLAVMFDVSEAKRTRSLLNQKYRMEAVGRLVGGVAHDFNNLLMVIRGNLEFMEDNFDDPLRETYLHDALTAAKRGAHLTRQLLSYGQKGHLRPRKVDLNRVVRDADSMLRRLVPEHTVFETVAFGGLWSVLLDHAQLETALLNLVINARDAMPSGGTITIETANIRISEEFLKERNEDIRPGRYVMLAVSDQGEGIARSVLDRVFEPFFTTKPVGVGSGLGLSMVQGFVKQSKGTVRIYSEEGFGTTIKMYFPAVDTAAGDPQYDAGDEIGSIGQSAEILVVEDEDSVRRLLVRQLSEQGYRVAEASSGDLALSILKTGYRPKLIITDMIMPGKVQGPELGRLAKEIIDDIHVIHISGYPPEAAINSNTLSADALQIMKPVSRKQLIAAVRKALDR